MKILLGVCGGVAAYKAAELLRALQRRGAEVQVAMTDGAMEFVQPLTFASLSGRQVITSLWQPAPVVDAGNAAEFPIEHITAVEHIDALVIAPATANHIAKFAHGIADDFLSTAYLATTAPVLLAPSMNVNMWEHAATQANMRLLAEQGVHVVYPGSGYLACGMLGGGRLAEVETIADAAMHLAAPVRDLEGETVLVTAGGTREPIDAVRFLGNRSSGRMGYALAEAAAARGARVYLVSAAARPAPRGVEVIQVNTAAEMRAAALKLLPRCTLVLKAAAVSDFRPADAVAHKLRRTGSLSLQLEPTADIVREIGERRSPGTLVIAFAAEVGIDLDAVRSKLERKGVDAIFVNDISNPAIGFESERNAGVFVTRENAVPFPELPKQEIADRILSEALKLRELTPHRANALA